MTWEDILFRNVWQQFCTAVNKGICPGGIFGGRQVNEVIEGAECVPVQGLGLVHEAESDTASEISITDSDDHSDWIPNRAPKVNRNLFDLFP